MERCCRASRITALPSCHTTRSSALSPQPTTPQHTKDLRLTNKGMVVFSRSLSWGYTRILAAGRSYDILMCSVKHLVQTLTVGPNTNPPGPTIAEKRQHQNVDSKPLLIHSMVSKDLKGFSGHRNTIWTLMDRSWTGLTLHNIRRSRICKHISLGWFSWYHN